MQSQFTRCCTVVACVFAAFALFIHSVDADDTVKVFILAGQSNMQGKASLVTLAHQIKDETRKATFAHLHDGKGNYKVRDDVFINFLDRRGKLEVGYGSRGRFGPELGFGWTVGEAIDEPVLIIKAAYGGRSLFRDFRSPSAGFPREEHRTAELENAKKRKPETTMEDVKQMYGFAYRDMMGEVNNVKSNYETLFPELKGKKLEMAGFVWFQGWNAMGDEKARDEIMASIKRFEQSQKSGKRGKAKGKKKKATKR